MLCVGPDVNGGINMSSCKWTIFQCHMIHNWCDFTVWVYAWKKWSSSLVPIVSKPFLLRVCIPSLKLTARTWKWMVGRWSFPFGWLIFRGCLSFREFKCFRPDPQKHPTVGFAPGTLRGVEDRWKGLANERKFRKPWKTMKLYQGPFGQLGTNIYIYMYMYIYAYIYIYV